MPETSIIIRTFNEEKHIGSLLRAIAQQDYKNLEVIIVDSGSTDRTLEIVNGFSVKIISIESRDFTFGYALNIGCKASRGKYLVFASAHVLPVNEKWLSNLIFSFSNPKVAMIYGRQMGNSESKFSERMDFQRIFKVSAVNSNALLNYANNANSAIKSELWKTNPFDEYLFGLEDIDWVKRMAKNDYLIHYEPKAAVYHLHGEEWHQVFNRYRREAIAAVRIGLEHPPQAKIGWFWPAKSLLMDVIASFPNWSFKRLEEIIRFRYYQWKGSRQGWFHDKDLDLNREKYNIFFHTENRAVVIRGKNRAKIEEMSLPEMKPGDILLKVEYVGICRTDLEVYERTLDYYRNGLANYPIVPGHEFSGTIIKIGANNKYRERFKVGERVVGECILSREHGSNRKEVGVINYNGAYSQLIVMPGDSIHKIPDNLDSKTASLTEPLAVVLRAIRRIKNRLSSRSVIAVTGAGPIGNFCAQVLSSDGYKVTVFDKNDERLNFLRNNAVKTSSSIDNLEKFDVIIEATGSKEILKQILEESHVDSTILLLGFPYGDINYNFENLVGKEKVIIGSVGAEPEDFPKALELLPKLDTVAFMQMILPLEDFKKAWSFQNSSKYLKILLKP